MTANAKSQKMRRIPRARDRTVANRAHPSAEAAAEYEQSVLGKQLIALGLVTPVPAPQLRKPPVKRSRWTQEAKAAYKQRRWTPEEKAAHEKRRRLDAEYRHIVTPDA